MTYLDANAAIARLHLKPERYSLLLQVYLKDFEHYHESIEDSYQSGDTDELKLQVHTLKGAAGNIGLNELFELTSRLNQKMVDGLPLDQTDIDAIYLCQVDTLKAIQQYLAA